MKFFNSKKKKELKVLKYITIALAIILVIELVYFSYKVITVRKNSTYYSAINSIIKDNEKFIAVGLSDFKHSKNIKYKTPGYNKPNIWIYNKNLEPIEEINFDRGYNGEYKNIIKVNDGYVAVGSIEMSEQQYKDSATEAIIVKYDEKFNVIWRRNYNPLGDSVFNNIYELDDGSLLAVGSSIYENNVIGNHTNGGAVIVKYTKDGDKVNEIEHGGPRSGEFNDIEVLKDGIIAVGVKANGTGIIFKYDFNGKELWHNYYGYTDSDGLTSITKINDNEFAITGSKLEDKNLTDTYKAVLLKINNYGKIIKEEIYQKDKISRFQDSVLIDNKLYVVGLYGSKKDKTLDNDSVVVTYNISLEKETEKIYNGNNTLSLNKIIDVNGTYLTAGHTNSKLKEGKLTTNGLDFYPLIMR